MRSRSLDDGLLDLGDTATGSEESETRLTMVWRVVQFRKMDPERINALLNAVRKLWKTDA